MPLNRRRFLTVSLATGLGARCGALGAVPLLPRKAERPQLAPSELRTLATYVDTLLPADHLSPGAAALQVHRAIEEKAAATPRYLRLLQEGCRWLDGQAQGQGAEDFAAPDDGDRESVVRRAEEADARSIERVFFMLTRRDAFISYYAHPETWAAVGYPGPPQPLGFMDYTEPPGPSG